MLQHIEVPGTRRDMLKHNLRPSHDLALHSPGPLLLLLLQRRLRRRQPGDRHAEGTAADVVEPDFVAEFYAVGLAAVFAADADFEVAARGTSLLDAKLHQAADAVEVDRLERVF